MHQHSACSTSWKDSHHQQHSRPMDAVSSSIIPSSPRFPISRFRCKRLPSQKSIRILIPDSSFFGLVDGKICRKAFNPVLRVSESSSGSSHTQLDFWRLIHHNDFWEIHSAKPIYLYLSIYPSICQSVYLSVYLSCPVPSRPSIHRSCLLSTYLASYYPPQFQTPPFCGLKGVV